MNKIVFAFKNFIDKFARDVLSYVVSKEDINVEERYLR